MSKHTIYVNYFPTDPTDEMLDDLKTFSDSLDIRLKEEVLQKFKALDGATYHYKYSPKLDTIETRSCWGFPVVDIVVVVVSHCFPGSL